MKKPNVVIEVEKILKKHEIEIDFSDWPEPFDDNHTEWYSSEDEYNLCIMISDDSEPVICFMDDNDFDCDLSEFENKLIEYME